MDTSDGDMQKSISFNFPRLENGIDVAVDVAVDGEVVCFGSSVVDVDTFGDSIVAVAVAVAVVADGDFPSVSSSNERPPRGGTACRIRLCLLFVNDDDVNVCIGYCRILISWT